MNELIVIFIVLGWVSLMLKSSQRTSYRNRELPPEYLRPRKKVSVPKMKNPPPPPNKCICNNIEEHSPGGRCKMCHSILKRPEFPKDRIGCNF